MHTIGLVFSENGKWGISFPDYPGCVSSGDSEEEVLLMGQEALDFHVEGMVAAGLALPAHHSLDALAKDPEFAREMEQAKFFTLVPITPPSKAVKVTITMEDALLARLNRAAESEGSTRSGFIADAVRRRLKERMAG